MKKEEIMHIVSEAVDSKIKSFSFHVELCSKIRGIVKEAIEMDKAKENKENKEKEYDLMVNFVRTIKNIFKNMFLHCSCDGQIYELFFESRNGRSKFCFSITEEEFNNLIPFVEVRF